MSSRSLHPEHLLDRLSGSVLGAFSRAALVAHARGCVACRFEICARADFAEELERGEFVTDDDPNARPVSPISTSAPHVAARRRKDEQP
jgi:hypothetical protein